MKIREVLKKLNEVNVILDEVNDEVQTEVERAKNLITEIDLHDLQKEALHASARAATIESGLSEYERFAPHSKKFGPKLKEK